MKNKIKYIAFDADDTLWDNEIFFYEFEEKFSSLIRKYNPNHEISKDLFEMEMKNLQLYGYGVKGMVLCMIELVCKSIDSKYTSDCILQVIQMGKDLLQKPVILLDDVTYTLAKLTNKYKLVLATKGDLLDQERKILKSGLNDYFHHIEIMSDKKSSDYSKLINRLDCSPENFLMLGNSLNSDIIPVLELGAFAGYIPYHITWKHEQCHEDIAHPHFIKLNQIKEILNYL
ncbi:MAG: HAD family hydrolase [Dysgonamonadaceae bacterium]